MDGLGQKRQRTADGLGDDDGDVHRHSDGQGGGDALGDGRVHIAEPEGVERERDQREHRADDEADAHLLPEELEDVLQFHLAEGEAADGQRRGLRAAVAARAHQHGDAGGEHHAEGRGLERVLVVGDDHAGEDGGDHQKQQPRHAVFGQRQNAGLEVFVLRGEHGGHFFKVLGVLLFDDVDDIVDGDDADHALLVIDHGDGDEVVLAHGVGDEFLIVGGVDADELLVHQRFHLYIVLRQEQLAQRQRAEQFALRIEHVERVDRLLVKAGAADLRHGLAHGGAHVQFHVLDGHDRAGAVFRVAQKLVDEGALLRVAAL